MSLRLQISPGIHEVRNISIIAYILLHFYVLWQQGRENIPKALAKTSLVIQMIYLDSGNVKREPSVVPSESMCTLSLVWISRDFLLAKTWMWLETWQKTERRKGKEKRVWLQRDGESLQWEPTLMLLWYSRTLLRARTWMWLDTYRVHSQHDLTYFRQPL